MSQSPSPAVGAPPGTTQGMSVICPLLPLLSGTLPGTGRTTGVSRQLGNCSNTPPFCLRAAPWLLIPTICPVTSLLQTLPCFSRAYGQSNCLGPRSAVSLAGFGSPCSWSSPGLPSQEVACSFWNKSLLCLSSNSSLCLHCCSMSGLESSLFFKSQHQPNWPSGPPAGHRLPGWV